MEHQEKKTLHPEIKGLLILALGLLLFLCLLSFSQGNPEKNYLGLVGYYVGLSLLYVFGLGSYLIIGWIGWIGWNILRFDKLVRVARKSLYFSFFVLSFCILLNLFAEIYPIDNPLIVNHVYSQSILREFSTFRCNRGGVPLYYLYRDLPLFSLKHTLSNFGILIIFSFTALLSFILFTNLRLVTLLKAGASFCQGIGNFVKNVIKDLKSSTFKEDLFPQKSPMPPSQTEQPPCESEVKYYVSTHLDKSAEEITNKRISITSYKGSFKHYRLPPLTLLSNTKKIDSPTLKRDLKNQAELLESTLMSFGIQARVGQIHSGPTITSFEVHPPVGVKVQKIKVLENDIALNLQAKSIRIIAPIPGKAAVGIEIPSPYPQEVGFKEMLSEYQKRGKKLHIPILLGKTVCGEAVMGDLTRMPHCIIAGATGSGKSVCINSIVMSILMIARPDEIRLLLIDPKKVELSAYTQIPHLIAPVITEAHGAYAALNWLVKEMQYRYEILKRLNLRNIHAFNNRKIRPQQEEETGLEIPRKMPYLVAIIDEFADLMMASSSDLETPIARIAQMARAIGIHLILATQRPSREVITGLIKANFPSRIAFKVASRVNSQIILDENGAESLLGNGDLLFMPPGSSQLIRAQGVFVRDADINRVISYVEDQLPPQYLIRSFDHMDREGLSTQKGNPKDDLYERAYRTVVDTGNASTTFLQRKLKIGYARAASLMDELEVRGVIGPQEGSRPRQVLATSKGTKPR
jgi:S-DNA-T family DNA segregation ATPase FtsK/SpoIIIE